MANRKNKDLEIKRHFSVQEVAKRLSKLLNREISEDNVLQLGSIGRLSLGFYVDRKFSLAGQRLDGKGGVLANGVCLLQSDQVRKIIEHGILELDCFISPKSNKIILVSEEQCIRDDKRGSREPYETIDLRSYAKCAGFNIINIETQKTLGTIEQEPKLGVTRAHLCVDEDDLMDFEESKYIESLYDDRAQNSFDLNKYSRPSACNVPPWEGHKHLMLMEHWRYLKLQYPDMKDRQIASKVWNLMGRPSDDSPSSPEAVRRIYGDFKKLFPEFFDVKT